MQVPTKYVMTAGSRRNVIPIVHRRVVAIVSLIQQQVKHAMTVAILITVMRIVQRLLVVMAM